ncbi:putative reverse transcriptase zinc-binding domain-containing protein [Arabidopsis thaliana]
MLWRAISKALPTCSRLVTRGMNISPYCSRCLTEEESICHVLFTCPYAMRIWRLSNLPQLTGLSITHDVEENISLLVDAYYNNNHTTQQKLLIFGSFGKFGRLTTILCSITTENVHQW